MKVGVPAEVKNNEYRVAITPAGVHELARAGHEVYVEARAGEGSSLPDEDFSAAGARILPTADDVWGTADLVLKVKEPIPDEYHRMRPGPGLLTNQEQAAAKEWAHAPITPKVNSITD
jgi:alanine dehydrogenase